MGDFNFYRSLEDIIRPGGDFRDTFRFNEAIWHLALTEILIKDVLTLGVICSKILYLNSLTDFMSVNWNTTYPNTLVLPLAKPILDHVPCKVVIGTSIPQASIFRFLKTSGRNTQVSWYSQI